MCLSTISKYLKNTEGKGWKVFKVSMKGDCITTTPRPTNKWIHENKFRPSTDAFTSSYDGPEYGYGFHIFKNKKDARRWMMLGDILKQVKYRNATVLGVQDVYGTNAIAIVADEIFIID